MNEHRQPATGGGSGANQFRRAAWEINRVLPALLVAAVVSLAGGCGGDSGTNPEPVNQTPAAGGTTTPPPTGGSGTTTPPTGGGTTTPPATGGGTTTPTSIVPTWYGVQANILQQYCTVCHSGANPPAGLSWEVGQYAAIVTNARMSTEISTMREVNPGNPDASYLIWKLRGQGPAGQAIQGVRMPAFGAALDPSLIAVVEQWIRDGAPLGTAADATASGTTTPPPTGGGTTTPPPTGGGTTTPSSIVPTWYGVQANILQQYCTVCHSGANPPAGLSWEVGQYATIVTNARMSTEISTLREISPGDPDASYLMWKLRGQGPAGQAIQGVRMPAFGAALDPSLIAVIEQWIRDGAPLGAPADATAGGTTTPPPTGGGTTTPPPTGGGTTPPASIVPTWYGVQANILQQYCTICHTGANAPAGLSWEVGQYATIVTNARMSTEIATLREVNPGDPDTSYLMWKLRGQGPAGQSIQGVRMPAIGPALSPALIAVVEQWIRDGAPLGTPADATAGGTPASTGGVPASAIAATWWGVQVNILQRACTACHDNYEPQAGLSWEPDQYSRLITGGRMSTQMPNLREIEPGNPDASYMMWKLRGRGPDGQAIVGARMPATGIPLDPALIEVVERWIRNGAPEGTIFDANAGGTVGPTYPVGSWMYVWTEALQGCAMCHNNAPANPRCGVDFPCPPKGVVLTADNYNGVVDGNLVRQFSPNQSKLWQRIADTNPASRMPLDLKPLTERQLGIVYDWIANGAPLCPANAVCP